MNEKDIIRNFISNQQHPSVAHGIGDDCAIINPSFGHQLVITTDSMVEGKHFVKQSPAYEVGYKLMATNLSDIASMCATPKWATLNLTLTSYDQSWVNNFANGLLDCANQHNIALVGGDTTKGNHLVLSLQLIGEVPSNSATLRDKAMPGDVIYVTGTIGCASDALKHLVENNYRHSSLSNQQISALYRPPSRINVAVALRHCINACIDVSDGLLHELEIVCNRSHTGAKLMLENIPIQEGSEIMLSITGGDDYELLFSADPKHSHEIAQIAADTGCMISPIGNITEGHDITLTLNSRPIDYPKVSGYDHFAGD